VKSPRNRRLETLHLHGADRESLGFLRGANRSGWTRAIVDALGVVRAVGHGIALSVAHGFVVALRRGVALGVAHGVVVALGVRRGVGVVTLCVIVARRALIARGVALSLVVAPGVMRVFTVALSRVL